jgi:hypothetical protein
MGMLRTRGPARIYKRVVQRLLNVVNNPLFEVGCIISEHPDPGDRLLHD